MCTEIWPGNTADVTALKQLGPQDETQFRVKEVKIGNAAYRRVLNLKAGGRKSGKVFQIDHGEAVLRYRDLRQIETLLRDAKSLLGTTPVLHSSDAVIDGYVFCSFLALVLKKSLAGRGARTEVKPKWAGVPQDLGRLQDIDISKDGKHLTLRAPTSSTNS